MLKAVKAVVALVLATEAAIVLKADDANSGDSSIAVAGCASFVRGGELINQFCCLLVVNLIICTYTKNKHSISLW